MDHEIIGIVGTVCILIGFAMAQMSRLDTQDWRYDGLNAIGALCLLWYAYQLNSVPFMALNAVWLLLSIKQLLIIKSAVVIEEVDHEPPAGATS